MKRPGTLIAIGLLFSAIAVFPGCGSQQTETVHSTTTTNTSQATTTDTSEQPQATTTATTDTTESKKPDSVLGAKAHAVGTVIMFPFRLIGDAVGLLV